MFNAQHQISQFAILLLLLHAPNITHTHTHEQNNESSSDYWASFGAYRSDSQKMNHNLLVSFGRVSKAEFIPNELMNFLQENRIDFMLRVAILLIFCWNFPFLMQPMCQFTDFIGRFHFHIYFFSVFMVEFVSKSPIIVKNHLVPTVFFTEIFKSK